MTKLLDQVVAVASQLSEEEQDRWAGLWLDELTSEHRWDAAFSASKTQLGTLAEEALSEHRAGRSRALDPDTL